MNYSFLKIIRTNIIPGSGFLQLSTGKQIVVKTKIALISFNRSAQFSE